jgi:hypothetical protein
MIAEAAYYLAQKRGFSGENALDDWLAAEQEIRQVISPIVGSDATMNDVSQKQLKSDTSSSPTAKRTSSAWTTGNRTSTSNPSSSSSRPTSGSCL